jgi:hypothetical protein
MSPENIHIEQPFTFAMLTVLFALLFRALNSLLRAYEITLLPEKDNSQKTIDLKNLPIGKRFKIIFSGISKSDPSPDIWYNTILGLLELIAFPILMQAGQYIMIGAWIGFKGIAQWSAWGNRFAFNRFLLIHAFVLFVSFWWLMNFITLFPTSSIH